MRGQGGIQMQLSPEQEAQQIVASARNMKVARLKQAKDESEQEAAVYRAHLEQEYQAKVSQNTGSSGWNVKRLDIDTEIKIQHLKDMNASISSGVVRMLLNHVTTSWNKDKRGQAYLGRECGATLLCKGKLLMVDEEVT
ncbi:V-type proton ATPase subunit G [Acorus calamus]|uniref:V-type proton ATPase subunit G n=1 Tax=Acorus calamus TaxID=4465 RepID=A0AAV9FBF7_ACOCL|nr:V-type proton ATPase subunit G [Acorus calamus]